MGISVCLVDGDGWWKPLLMSLLLNGHVHLNRCSVQRNAMFRMSSIEDVCVSVWERHRNAWRAIFWLIRLPSRRRKNKVYWECRWSICGSILLSLSLSLSLSHWLMNLSMEWSCRSFYAANIDLLVGLARAAFEKNIERSQTTSKSISYVKRISISIRRRWILYHECGHLSWWSQARKSIRRISLLVGRTTVRSVQVSLYWSTRHLMHADEWRWSPDRWFHSNPKEEEESLHRLKRLNEWTEVSKHSNTSQMIILKPSFILFASSFEIILFSDIWRVRVRVSRRISCPTVKGMDWMALPFFNSSQV
jgi:hypothetical protein